MRKLVEKTSLTTPISIDLRVPSELLLLCGLNSLRNPFLECLRFVRREELLDVGRKRVPRRIANHGVEATPLDDDLGKLKCPVEEMPLVCNCLSAHDLVVKPVRNGLRGQNELEDFLELTSRGGNDWRRSGRRSIFPSREPLRAPEVSSRS